MSRIRGRHILSLLVLASLPLATRAADTEYDHAPACLAKVESVRSKLVVSDFAAVAREFVDLEDDHETNRISTWFKVLTREFGYPDRWEIVPESESPSETEKFGGFAIFSVDFDRLRKEKHVSKLLVRVEFSHEGEGAMEFQFMRDSGDCDLALVVAALPKSRPDAYRRISEVGGFAVEEMGAAPMSN